MSAHPEPILFASPEHREVRVGRDRAAAATAMGEYRAEQQALHDRSVRLRALREAKEAADVQIAAAAPVRARSKPRKHSTP